MSNKSKTAVDLVRNKPDQKITILDCVTKRDWNLIKLTLEKALGQGATIIVVNK